MISKKLLKIPVSYSYNSNNSNGYFLALNSSMGATNECSCREEFFHYFHTNTKLIGFMTSVLNIPRLNDFFEEIETKLKLKKGARTVFFKTNFKNVVLIEVADFWLDHEAKRSLFTLLLRLGAVYLKTNIDNAISGYSLARETREAINWFLKGNTIPTFQKIGGGWHNKFNGVEGGQLSRLLTQKSLISYGGIKMYPAGF